MVLEFVSLLLSRRFPRNFLSFFLSRQSRDEKFSTTFHFLSRSSPNFFVLSLTTRPLIAFIVLFFARHFDTPTKGNVEEVVVEGKMERRRNGGNGKLKKYKTRSQKFPERKVVFSFCRNPFFFSFSVDACRFPCTFSFRVSDLPSGKSNQATGAEYGTRMES